MTESEPKKLDEASVPSPGTIRLNKRIADSGFCARRKADDLIAAGRVQVNGETIREMGCRVHPENDTVLIDGHPLPESDKVYIVLHKPVGFVTTRRGQGHQQTIYELLPKEWRSVDPAGRLDLNSSGLLLLSNDGDFIHRLSHPNFHWAKVYHVALNHTLDDAALQQLRDGILLQPENKLAVMEIEPLSHADKKNTYRIVLLTGYNRQIRRSIEAVGARVWDLHRVSFGPIEIGNLPPSRLRELTPDEHVRLQQPVDKAQAVQ